LQILFHFTQRVGEATLHGFENALAFDEAAMALVEF